MSLSNLVSFQSQKDGSLIIRMTSIACRTLAHRMEWTLIAITTRTVSALSALATLLD